jgi:hypothetical protein
MADPGGFTVDPAVLSQRLTDSFGQFFDNIGNLARGAADAATGIESDIADLEGIIQDWTEMKANLSEEVQKLKDFEFNPHWKSRVINVPIAIDQIRELIDEIFHQVRDKLETIVQPFVIAVNAIKVVQQTSTQSTGRTRGGLVQTVNHAAGYAQYIRFAFSQSRAAFDAAKELTELFKDITDKLSGAEAIFLQQKNPRQSVTVKARERVGKLHSSTAA